MPIDIDPLAANGVPHWFSVLIRAPAFSTDSLRIMAMPSRVDSLPARVVDVSILRSIIEHTDISAPPPPPTADIKSAPPPPVDFKFRESHWGDDTRSHRLPSNRSVWSSSTLLIMLMSLAQGEATSGTSGAGYVTDGVAVLNGTLFFFILLTFDFLPNGAGDPISFIKSFNVPSKSTVVPPSSTLIFAALLIIDVFKLMLLLPLATA